MLRTFLFSLFATNERLAMSYPSTRPLTDDELAGYILEEFPDDAKVHASLNTLPRYGSTSRIRIWRSEYNRGLWQAPTYRSFRYNSLGEAINRNENALSAEAVASAILKFPYDDPRKILYQIKEDSHVSAVTEARSINSVHATN